MDYQSFERYGIKLERLKEENLEMLRSWRNNEENAKQMRLQNGRKITKTEHLKWFEKIKNSNNAFYFLAYYNNQVLGCLSIKDIDWRRCCGDPGSVFDPLLKDENPAIKFYCEFASHDLYFEEMKLDFTHTFVKNTNKQAIRYNKFLGYEPIKEFDEKDFFYFKLESKKYFIKRNRTLQTLKNV